MFWQNTASEGKIWNSQTSTENGERSEKDDHYYFHCQPSLQNCRDSSIIVPYNNVTVNGVKDKYKLKSLLSPQL